MLPYFWYLLKVIICSGILFGYYWLFLRNKIFHQYNRFYLLAAMGLSLLLPLLKINFWQQGAENNQAIRVLRAVSVGDEYMSNIVITANSSSWNFQNMYPLVYWIVSLVFLFVLVRTLFIIRTLLKKYPVQQIEEVTFVNTSDDSTPFSFFNYIFWNSSIDMSTVTGKQIFKHEVAHIQEKHTYDKLFVGVVLIFCWCNPFFWLYRKELNMIHEFIADKKAVQDSDTSAFAAMILQTAYPKQRFELTNNFFYSPIKRRLLMLTKIDNPRVSYFVRVMALPLVVLVFAAFTFKAKTNASVYHGKKITVVIDAGHGGQDLGAKSIDGIYEKNFTLAIAKKVKELNISNDIEIVLTRENDITQTPQQKLDIAESKQADLLISFHCDAQPANTVNKKSGLSIYISKDNERMTPQSKLLASSVIESFKLNYSLPVNETLGQRYITAKLLKENSFPAIIIQTGFITTPADLAYLKTNDAKETIAKNVLAAIEKYLTINQSNPASTNKTDTIPTLVASKNDIDTFNYYRDYGISKTYKGQKIKAVFLRNTDNKMIVELVNGSKYIMDQKEIYKANIISPPPPPPPPPPARFNPTIKSTDTNPDVELLTSYKSLLYIGINNHVYVAVKNIRAEDISLRMSPLGSLNGSGGEYTVRVSSVGNTSINVINNKTGELLKSFAFEVKRIPDPSDPDFPSGLKVISVVEPKIFVGDIANARADVELFKKQKEIRTTRGYVFNDAMVYFSGASFKEVVKVQLNGSSLKPVEEYIERCTAGSVMTFDNVRVKDSDGKLITIGGMSLALYEPNEITDQIKAMQLQKEKFSLQQEQQAKAKSDFEKNQATLKKQDIAKEKELVALKEQQHNDENKIFTKAEVAPQFTGGEDAWRKYLQANLKANTPVDEGWKAGKYTVIIKFIVRTDGTVSDIKAETFAGTKTARHCIDIIKNAPTWTPAVQNGRKVNAYKRQPITFLIEEAEEKIK